MHRRLRVRQAGNALAVTIPPELADLFAIRKGDDVFLLATENGVLVTPYDPATDEALAAYERTAARYRAALRDMTHDHGSDMKPGHLRGPVEQSDLEALASELDDAGEPPPPFPEPLAGGDGGL